MNTSYDNQTIEQLSRLTTSYPTQSFYQETSYNTLEQYGTIQQYHYDSQTNHWRTKTNNTTGFSMYDRPLTTYYTSTIYSPKTTYPFTKQTNFFDYNEIAHDARRPAYYRYSADPVYPMYSNQYDYTTTNLDYIPAAKPKVRTIFVPSFYSPLQQQLYAYPYRAIPFLYDRNSQPVYSSELTRALLPTTSRYPAVDQQQLAKQTYVNLSMTTPSNSNYQLSPPMLPIYPMIPQIQQQPYITPSNLQFYQTAQPSQYNNINYPVMQPTNDYPLVSQYASNENKQQFLLSNTDQSTFTDIFSSNLPPFPPGAVLISDEYLNTNDSFDQLNLSKKKRKKYRHIRRSAKRTIPIKAYGTATIQSNQILPSDHTSDTSSERTPLASKNIALSRTLLSASITDSIKPEKDETTNQQPIASSNNEKGNELRDLRLSLVNDDNPTDIFSSNNETISVTIIQDEAPIRDVPSPTISQSKKSDTDIVPIQETHQRSPTLSTSHTENNFDKLSLRTISQSDKQSERNFNTIDNN